jgi:hypothetical protein
MKVKKEGAKWTKNSIDIQPIGFEHKYNYFKSSSNRLLAPKVTLEEHKNSF